MDDRRITFICDGADDLEAVVAIQGMLGKFFPYAVMTRTMGFPQRTHARVLTYDDGAYGDSGWIPS